MHVYLTGFMGAGKSTVGHHLADRLGWRFVDLDEIIETEAGRTIPEIFEAHGEGAFRRREMATLKSLDETESMVIATGGGAVSAPENREWMRSRGITVWLDAPFSLLIERLRAHDPARRPLFTDEAQAHRLYRQRLAAYRESEVRIGIGSSDPVDEVAQSIVAALRERQCAI